MYYWIEKANSFVHMASQNSSIYFLEYKSVQIHIAGNANVNNNSQLLSNSFFDYENRHLTNRTSCPYAIKYPGQEGDGFLIMILGCDPSCCVVTCGQGSMQIIYLE